MADNKQPLSAKAKAIAVAVARKRFANSTDARITHGDRVEVFHRVPYTLNAVWHDAGSVAELCRDAESVL